MKKTFYFVLIALLPLFACEGDAPEPEMPESNFPEYPAVFHNPMSTWSEGAYFLIEADDQSSVDPSQTLSGYFEGNLSFIQQFFDEDYFLERVEFLSDSVMTVKSIFGDSVTHHYELVDNQINLTQGTVYTPGAFFLEDDGQLIIDRWFVTAYSYYAASSPDEVSYSGYESNPSYVLAPLSPQAYVAAKPQVAVGDTAVVFTVDVVFERE